MYTYYIYIYVYIQRRSTKKHRRQEEGAPFPRKPPTRSLAPPSIPVIND